MLLTYELRGYFGLYLNFRNGFPSQSLYFQSVAPKYLRYTRSRVASVAFFEGNIPVKAKMSLLYAIYIRCSRVNGLDWIGGHLLKILDKLLSFWASAGVAVPQILVAIGKDEV